MATITSTLSVRVPTEIKNEIELLATNTHRKKTDILVSWINEKLELEKWQIETTKKALEELDREEFADPKQVTEFFKQWS